MTQALQAKQVNRGLGQAGWILDHWIASFLAAVERSIRRRRAKHRAAMQAANPISIASTCKASGTGSASSL
jgi:hypothetical protein